MLSEEDRGGIRNRALPREPGEELCALSYAVAKSAELPSSHRNTVTHSCDSTPIDTLAVET
jgi:hypothetical protein